jgi:DNA polymerase-3 subunit alpha
MAIAQKLAGLHPRQADLLRRAMGKKKKEVLDAEFVPFSGACWSNGYSEASIKTLWDILVPFSDYAFNKAHSAAYGLVSYWTAYLKANYPAEYMAALLHLGQGRQGQVGALPRRVPPHGHQGAAPRRQRVRGHVHRGRRPTSASASGDPQRRRQRRRGASSRPASARGRPPRTSTTSSTKVPAVVCNKRTIESLIKAGAFDGLGQPRMRVAAGPRGVRRRVRRGQAQEAIGQDSLFGFVR